jgi:hypothetical protein
MHSARSVWRVLVSSGSGGQVAGAGKAPHAGTFPCAGTSPRAGTVHDTPEFRAANPALGSASVTSAPKGPLLRD